MDEKSARLGARIVALEAELAELHGRPYPGHTGSLRVQEAEAHLMRLYCRWVGAHTHLDERAVAPADAGLVCRKLRGVGEVDFYLWLAGRGRREVLGRSGPAGDVLCDFFADQVGVGRTYIEVSGDTLVITGDGWWRCVRLPGWAIYIQQVTRSAWYARDGCRITAGGLRRLLRCSRRTGR